MLSNFIVSVEAVLPMFLLMLVGVGIKFSKLMTYDEMKHLNKTVFTFMFPCMMFTNLYGKNVAEILDVKILIFTFLGVMAELLISFLIVPRIEKAQKTRGAMIQAIYRSNLVIMGLPIVQNIFGAENTGVTAVVVTLIVPLYNIIAVIVLETFRGGKVEPKKILLGIAKNPLILGAVVATSFMVLQLNLPNVILSPIKSLSSVATPMALIILGASFNFTSVKEGKRNVVICVLSRLVIVPAVMLTLAFLFGFRNEAFVTLVAVFASPSAVSSFTMAQAMDSDYDLAGNAVFISSALACFTMFLWLFVFKCFGAF